MNPYNYYNLSKTKWSECEIEQLRREYSSELLDIIQCANIHRRTPGCIAYKLKTIGLIIHNTAARGYIEYKNSTLYEEAVLVGKQKKEQQRLRKNDKNGVNIVNELMNIKKDIAELKTGIKEILAYIHSNA